MGTVLDHPVYLHSYVGDDGVAVLVEGATKLYGLIQEGKLLFFGYWRPCRFNEITSMHRSPEGYLISGITGEVTVSDAECEADPATLLDRWIAVTAADRARDMADREEAVRRRAAEDAAHTTRFTSGPRRGQTVEGDALSIRMALQEKAGLSYGREVGSEAERKVIARLVWIDGVITFQSTLPPDIHRVAARDLTWAAPGDLDRITEAWMTFCFEVRSEFSWLDTVAAARSAAAG